MAIFNGTELGVYISDTLIAAAQSVSVSLSLDTIEITTNDSAGWSEFLAGKRGGFGCGSAGSLGAGAQGPRFRRRIDAGVGAQPPHQDADRHDDRPRGLQKGPALILGRQHVACALGHLVLELAMPADQVRHAEAVPTA